MDPVRVEILVMELPEKLTEWQAIRAVTLNPDQFSCFRIQRSCQVSLFILSRKNKSLFCPFSIPSKPILGFTWTFA